MKILVDINHPAHVHYFKNLINELKDRGHTVVISTVEKDIAIKLLNLYSLDHINLGKLGKTVFNKAINVFLLDLKLYFSIKKFKPDIFLGFASIRCAHVSKLINSISINIDDTEHSPLEQMLYVPFTDYILSSHCFKKDFGKKHFRFKGLVEYTYLNPKVFIPNPEYLNDIGLNIESNYTIIRFVSWKAFHDLGHSGIKSKINFIQELERYSKVFISSEDELPIELKKYKIEISPEKIHHILYYATLFVGESGTMSTESALLGTHSVMINSLLKNEYGSFLETEKYGLSYNFKNEEEGLKKAIELIQMKNLKLEGKEKVKNIYRDFNDINNYILNFIENLPDLK